MQLGELFERSLARDPGRCAVSQVDGRAASYAELDERVAVLAEALRAAGVRPGQRVGIQVPKSIASLACVLAVLRAGGTYVPVDATAPIDRNATIFDDCAVAAVLVDDARHLELLGALTDQGREYAVLRVLPDGLVLLGAAEPDPTLTPELAYILYTSGSTGRPKGVMITHENALSFVRWCADVFDVGPTDVFSSHAPFHFDLSILDIYLCLHAGGTLVLIDEATGKQPRALAPLIAERGITVWYSTPSILSLLVQHGRLERHDHSALRYVLFAGEVFPVRHLRALTEAWTGPRYVNLYGPTETNVCTWHEVALPVPAQRTEPYPIGPACAHAECVVVDDGRVVEPGREGELVVRGAPVTRGYWNLPERDAQAFLELDDGTRWYRTGDIVRETDEGYVFVGRRDRMVKRRGNRVELGEIEARLHTHPDLSEVAVIAHADEEQGVRVRAFLVWKDGARPSLIALKKFCAETLPTAMVPDAFEHLDALPKTSTDKIDYRSLERA